MSEDAHADAVTPSLRVVERERTDGARPERAQPQHKALDDTKYLRQSLITAWGVVRPEEADTLSHSTRSASTAAEPP